MSPFWTSIQSQKGDRKQRIAFSDATDPRILKAAQTLSKSAHIEPLLIGSLNHIQEICEKSKIPSPASSQIIDLVNSSKLENLKSVLIEKQAHFKVSESIIVEQLKDTLYQGVALLLKGEIDGLVAGSLRPTADIVKAAIKCIGPKRGKKLISGQFFIESAVLKTKANTPFLFSDCAVVPEPSPRVLAASAISAAESFKFFTGQEPFVSLLSFSTRGSAEHALVDRIREALKIIKKLDSQLVVDGEIQVDAALDPSVALIKRSADSPILEKANVFIFPTLESGNIGYKLVQRFSEARIAGPLLWGLDKPLSDLSRGCTVQEIIDTTFCLSKMIAGQN